MGRLKLRPLSLLIFTCFFLCLFHLGQSDRVSDPLCPPADRIAPCRCQMGHGRAKIQVHTQTQNQKGRQGQRQKGSQRQSQRQRQSESASASASASAESSSSQVVTKNLGLVVNCQGYSIDQSAIEKTIQHLRNFNGLKPSQFLSLTQFNIAFTRMLQLDISPFRGVRLNALRITNNMFLSDILGPNQMANLNLTSVSDPLTPPELKSGLLGNPEEGESEDLARAGLSQGKIPREIKVRFVDLSNNALKDEGVVDTLIYFSPNRLFHLDLSQNRIQGKSSKFLIQNTKNKKKPQDQDQDEEDEKKTSPVGEFLPGLSSFTNLQNLNLSRNEIQSLKNGPFRRNNKLRVLALNNNRIEELGQNSFQFNELEDDDSSEEQDDDNGNNSNQDDDDDEDGLKKYKRIGDLRIHLEYNRLRTPAIHGQNGLENFQRPVKIYLERNQLNFITSKNFASVLGRRESLIDLKGNPLVCDKKLKWLKKKKKQMQARVRNAQCINDPQNNVFTSALIK